MEPIEHNNGISIALPLTQKEQHRLLARIAPLGKRREP